MFSCFLLIMFTFVVPTQILAGNRDTAWAHMASKGQCWTSAWGVTAPSCSSRPAQCSRCKLLARSRAMVVAPAHPWQMQGFFESIKDGLKQGCFESSLLSSCTPWYTAPTGWFLWFYKHLPVSSFCKLTFGSLGSIYLLIVNPAGFKYFLPL